MWIHCPNDAICIVLEDGTYVLLIFKLDLKWVLQGITFKDRLCLSTRFCLNTRRDSTREVGRHQGQAKKNFGRLLLSDCRCLWLVCTLIWWISWSWRNHVWRAFRLLLGCSWRAFEWFLDSFWRALRLSLCCLLYLYVLSLASLLIIFRFLLNFVSFILQTFLSLIGYLRHAFWLIVAYLWWASWSFIDYLWRVFCDRKNYETFGFDHFLKGVQWVPDVARN